MNLKYYFMPLRRPQCMLWEAILINPVQTIIGVVLPVLARQRFGASSWLLGIYGSSCFLLYALTAWRSGSLGDRLGRRPVILAGLALVAIGLLLTITAKGPLAFFGPFLFCGAGFGTIWPSLEAGLTESLTPRQTKRVIGIFCYAWMLATASGAVFFGVLLKMGGLPPMIAGLVLLALSAALLFWPGAMRDASWNDLNGYEDDHRVSSARQRLFVNLALTSNLVMSFMIGSYRSLLAIYANAPGVGITGWRWGLLSGVLQVGMAAGVGILMVWRGWHYSLRFLIGAEAWAAGMLVLFVLTHQFWLLTALVLLLGLPTGIVYFSALYYGMALNEEKGAHGGNFEGLIGLGQALGPFIGGFIISFFYRAGFPNLAPRSYLLADALLFLALIAMQWVWSGRATA